MSQSSQGGRPGLLSEGELDRTPRTGPAADGGSVDAQMRVYMRDHAIGKTWP